MALYSKTLTSTFLNCNGNGSSIKNHKTSKTSARRSLTIQMMASTMESYEEGNLDRPKWTGQTPLSRLVAALISFKPLYSVMKFGARQALIRMIMLDHCVVIADYLNPFHAYDEGNLSWLAAAEAEPATMSITRRAIPDAASLDEAIEVVRGNWLRVIEQHHLEYSGNSVVADILDIGCSVGWSTRFLANKFPSANITGLDLSPYFLAVAQYKEKNGSSSGKCIKWVHANGEDTGLPAKSFDIVSIAYVLHECPAIATVNLVKEAFRLLRPGGTIAITDNSPKSKKLQFKLNGLLLVSFQELSPVLFTLMKSTEPFLDEYYLLDLESALREAGFINVQTILTDPRHRTVTATVPH
uniref:Methyltransferase type 11 domain-containing protein n=1 Tax=Chenopodium quinoa TaxID=63459 RepID=A0A803N1Q7_CHEQI